MIRCALAIVERCYVQSKAPALLNLYRSKGTPLDLKQLEDQVRDRRLTFNNFRVCQHGNDACYHGSLDHDCDDFAAGHIA
jgi:hypothetical protein